MYACSDIEGNLVGVSGRDTWYPDVLGPGKVPLGMVYVPSGAYQAGEDDEDIMGFHTARKRTVSVPAFYMDATEISNNEYRQFVHWVRDSIAREKLYRRSYDEEAERWVNIPDNFFKEPYRTLMAMGSDLQGGNTPFQLFMDSTNGAEVDKTIMTMLGSYDKSKGKGKKLVNGFQYDQKKYGIAGGPEEKFDVVMSDDDLRGIFQMYSGAAKKNAPDKTSAKGASTKTKYNQGGRVENRKYFTLNWLEPVDYEDPEVAFMLSDMYLSEAERFYNRREIDTRLLYFDYYWIDYKEAARRGKIITKSIDARKTFAYDSLDKEAENTLYQRSRREPLGKDYKSNDLHRSTLMTMDQNTNKVWVDTTGYTEQWSEFSKLNDTNSLRGTILQNPGQDLDLGFTNSKGSHNAIRGHSDRSRFIIKERINIYPDTLCWVRDFTYANKSAMTQNYFWNTAYDNYPVVGVTWSQAKAFSVWRTQIFHSWLQSNGDLFVNDFRLPTESEWERGARGDLDNMQYPWGGPYIRNSSGCFLANFKPMRGRYFEDGGFYTVKVYSYNPNGFGLYCMAGNVAEWCSTAYDESTYEFAHDMAQDFEYDAKDGEAPVKKRKVLRGGSWKDIGYYLMNATRTYEYQDTAKSYIGFRNTMTHLGRGGKDIEQENGEEIQTDIILN
ncbi:MAG: SUMF1/EgtB/PvdO family nonheme iron enzyme [Crocinitomicaceae bacterium]|nr:SUMF1/EgtB/PvdO family nonheme iron enzyme [Crocinitomicaceae bacterium]